MWSVAGWAQYAPYTFPNPGAYGTVVQRSVTLKTQLIPTICGVPTNLQGRNIGQAGLVYDSCGHDLYVFDPTDSTFSQVGGGSGNGVDSVVDHSHPYTDSLFYYVGATPHFIKVFYHPDGLIKPGIVTYASGTTYIVTAALYSILGTIYQSHDTTQILAALPSVGHSRKDVIYVLNNNTTSHQTGVLDAGAAPTISPDTGVVLAYIDVRDTGVTTIPITYTNYWTLTGGTLAPNQGTITSFQNGMAFFPGGILGGLATMTITGSSTTTKQVNISTPSGPLTNSTASVLYVDAGNSISTTGSRVATFRGNNAEQAWVGTNGTWFTPFLPTAVFDTTTFKLDVLNSAGEHKRMAWPTGGGGGPTLNTVLTAGNTSDKRINLVDGGTGGISFKDPGTTLIGSIFYDNPDASMRFVSVNSSGLASVYFNSAGIFFKDATGAFTSQLYTGDRANDNAFKLPNSNRAADTLATLFDVRSGASGTPVTSVTGTASRITSTGGTTPVIDISATFEGLLGKVANPLSQFAATTSAQLRGVLSDEVGTGAAYFVGGALSTPASVNLTNGTALPVGGISATGTPGSGNFLRGDGTWSAAGGVDLTQVDSAIQANVDIIDPFGFLFFRNLSPNHDSLGMKYTPGAILVAGSDSIPVASPLTVNGPDVSNSGFFTTAGINSAAPGGVNNFVTGDKNSTFGDYDNGTGIKISGSSASQTVDIKSVAGTSVSGALAVQGGSQTILTQTTESTTIGDGDHGTFINISGSDVDNKVNYNSASIHDFQTGTVTMGAYGAGAATFDASGNITSVSDVRLKNVLGYSHVGLNAVMKLKPIIYKWNGLGKEKHELDSTYVGFSAQNVKANITYGTGVNKDGYLSLQDRAVLAAAIVAIQELNKKINTQVKEIKLLKAKLKK